MDIVKNHVSYKCFGIEGRKFEIPTFTRIHPSVQSIHLQMDNGVALSYLVKIGGSTHKKVRSDISKDIWLGLLAGQRDHNYSRIPSRCSQQGSWIPVASSERLKRMEIGSQSFSNNMQKRGASRHRLFLLPEFLIRSQHTFHGSWIHSVREGTLFKLLRPIKKDMFTPFCINRSRLEGSARGESKLAANYPSLGNAIMVSTTVTTHRANTILSKNSEPFITSKQRKASLDRAGKLKLLTWTASG